MMQNFKIVVAAISKDKKQKRRESSTVMAVDRSAAYSAGLAKLARLMNELAAFDVEGGIHVFKA
jgi:hypothetical protein